MRKTSKLISFAAAAALLLSGCGTGNPVPSVSESGTTTSAAETTTAEENGVLSTTDTEVTASVSATTTAANTESNIVHSDEKTSGITYSDCIGKKIICDNTEDMASRYKRTLEEGFEPGVNVKVWNLDRGTELSIEPYYGWSLDTRISTGVISDKCDDDFKKSVASTMCSFYEDTRFTYAHTRVYIDKVDSTSVYADEIVYGYDPVCHDSFIIVNGFIRKTGYDRDIQSYKFEYIIDPACMNLLRLPMMVSNPEKMKFEVNGTEFYADTMRGTGTSVMYLGNPNLNLDGKDFIYARIALMAPSFMYSTKDGAHISASVVNIEPIDSDTEKYIKGEANAPAPEAPEGLSKAMTAAKDEMFTDKTISFSMLDLDFDGTPEILVQEGTSEELDSPYGSAHATVYGYSGDALKKLGEFDTVGYEPLEEVLYIPKNERGWHFTDYKNHCFLTLKNGRLDILHVTEVRGSGVTDENGYEKNDFYFLGEKIVIEPYESYNPILGRTETYYKWASANSLGYSVMADDPYRVYDMLYENLGDLYFKINRKYYLGEHLNMWGDDPYTHIDPPSNYPDSVIGAYYTAAHSSEYDKFYGLSFESAKEKPVIYLYPEEQTDVSVQVNFPLGGEFTCTYPEYGNGWNVTAMPDGTLYDMNGDEYYCLYWEGKSRDVMDDSKGFCVAGKDTAKFLREKLMYIGLSAREANEFIIYWLPKMQDNPYNVITLHTDDYARSVPLTVSPAPDTQIRVFMTYYSSDTPVDIPEQKLPHYERNGFTLVEWGGSEE